jgi:hypothetical protein
MISRCSEARERTVNRSEWSSETTTDDTTADYRKNARNLNRRNSYSVFDSHRQPDHPIAHPASDNVPELATASVTADSTRSRSWSFT